MATRAEDPPPDGADTPTADGDAVARAIAQVCGGLAHGFSNQLTILRGNLHLLSVDPSIRADPERAELVAAIQSAADEFALTVRGLALVAGSATPTTRSIDLNALIRRQTERIAAFLGRRIEIRLTLADGLPPVAVDPTDLQSALQALALNAREAIAGHGLLAITTRLCTDDDDTAAVPQACIDVADSGRGMTAEELAALTRLPVSAQRHRKSAGLGLTIVYRAVEGAGGRVHLASVPGEGTTVTLSLPPAATLRDPA